MCVFPETPNITAFICSILVHLMQWKDRISPCVYLHSKCYSWHCSIFHHHIEPQKRYTYWEEIWPWILTVTVEPQYQAQFRVQATNIKAEFFLQCQDQKKQLMSWMVFQLVLMVLLNNQWLVLPVLGIYALTQLLVVLQFGANITFIIIVYTVLLVHCFLTYKYKIAISWILTNKYSNYNSKNINN